MEEKRGREGGPTRQERKGNLITKWMWKKIYKNSLFRHNHSWLDSEWQRLPAFFSFQKIFLQQHLVKSKVVLKGGNVQHKGG